MSEAVLPYESLLLQTRTYLWNFVMDPSGILKHISFTVIVIQLNKNN